jgi:hypothetical protein
VPLADAADRAIGGELDDGKTIIGLARAAARLAAGSGAQ